MHDVVTCPRINCETPVIGEQDSNLAVCHKCSFSFCKMCLRSFHGVEICTHRNERVAKIRDAYEKGDVRTKRELELKYGKQQLLNYVHESRSIEWVSNNSKACPSCHIGTQKTKGCNKMWCARCGCHWCWLCNTKLKKANPYAHFSAERSACYQKLYDGMSEAERMAAFEAVEEPIVQHERPPEAILPVNRAAPVVEVHINPQALGLLGPEDPLQDREATPGPPMDPGELDMLALQLQQQLIEDDDFQVELRNDGLIYAELQPQN
ncbi:E3 ubiquitin-protein ligase RNF14-like [Symsagittifera roscoffensis]|uniref:E3 ubiquitin-protein ligase RNF14-like n=1 Tax=Symsagittifera roscoffensis TaxID=84072 RepID=UPI00307B6DF3